MRKKMDDVRGYKISCISFEACPLCYGCRAYRPDDSECLICEKEDEKKNLCKVRVHKSDVIDRFVPKHTINLDLQGGFDFEHRECDCHKTEGAKCCKK